MHDWLCQLQARHKASYSQACQLGQLLHWQLQLRLLCSHAGPGDPKVRVTLHQPRNIKVLQRLPM
jgi:hypothetical protein